MTEAKPLPLPFEIEVLHNVMTRVQLPAQEPMDATGYYNYPAVELALHYRQQDSSAVRNALYLLRELYDVGVTSPHVLRLILKATGQRQSADLPSSAHAQTNTSSVAPTSPSAPQSQSRE